MELLSLSWVLSSFLAWCVGIVHLVQLLAHGIHCLDDFLQFLLHILLSWGSIDHEKSRVIQFDATFSKGSSK